MDFAWDVYHVYVDLVVRMNDPGTQRGSDVMKREETVPGWARCLPFQHSYGTCTTIFIHCGLSLYIPAFFAIQRPTTEHCTRCFTAFSNLATHQVKQQQYSIPRSRDSRGTSGKDHPACPSVPPKVRRQSQRAIATSQRHVNIIPRGYSQACPGHSGATWLARTSWSSGSSLPVVRIHPSE